jgi:hypothetical protein
MHIRVLAAFKMKALAVCFIFFRLIYIALGDVEFSDFEKLPTQINRYLETKIMPPDLKNIIRLIRQRKVMKPYSKIFDMELLENKDEAQIRSVIKLINIIN